MLHSLIYSANALLPVIIIISFGMFLYKRKFFDDNFIKTADRFVFNIALPMYLFNEISKANIDEVFNPKLIIFSVVCILIIFVSLVLIMPLFIKNKGTRGAFIQGAFRSNFAILGMPLAENLYGKEGTQTAALILPFIIPIFNVLAVIVLTLNTENAENTDGNKQNKKLSELKKVLVGIIKNPLIIAVLSAVPFMFMTPLPTFADKTISYIANLSTPLALLSLGTSVNFTNAKRGFKTAFSATILRTVIIPLIVVILAILLGFRNVELIVIFILFGAPTAVSSYIMSKNMNSDYELSGQIVVLTTIFCFFTIFTGSFILKSFYFI